MVQPILRLACDQMCVDFRCFLEQETTLIPQCWLVQGMDLSVIYISRVVCFQIKLK